MKDFSFGLDVGSSTIKLAVIAREKSDQPLKAALLVSYPSRGMRRGFVNDISGLRDSLEAALLQTEERLNASIKQVNFGFNNPDVHCKTQKGSVIVSRDTGEIGSSDIFRVLQSARVGALPPNRHLLHIIPLSYTVDGVSNIKDPGGMTGSKIEVDALIVDTFEPPIKNLVKAVKDAGLSIKEFSLSILAGANIALTKRDREVGAIAIDFGSDMTSAAIFEDDTLLGVETFPVGSSHITQDIAIGLKTSLDVAEKIKLAFAHPNPLRRNEKINLADFTNEEGEISKKYISEIIDARVEEILRLINAFLKKYNRDAKLPAGAVLFGGGAKLAGILQKTKSVLRLPARLSIDQQEYMDVSGDDLKLDFVNAVGLALLSGKEHQYSFEEGIWGKIKDTLGHFAP